MHKGQGINEVYGVILEKWAWLLGVGGNTG